VIKILLYILLIYIVYKVFRSLVTPSGSSTTRSHGGADSFDDVMVKDPVCEVYFPKKDGIYLNNNGNEIYFCSKECRDKFLDLQSKK